MSQELKAININAKSETTFKERLWVIIPVILLVGLISTLVYNHYT